MQTLKRSEGGADPLLVARRMFFDHGNDPGTLIPEPIARSWRRCVGVPTDTAPAEPLPHQALFSRRDAQGRLRQHALPELEALAEALVPSRVIVLLADPEGMILDAAGSDAFMSKAQRVALMPGVDWSEGIRGTNAIGTALTDGAAVTVIGQQHYLERNATLGCTATPLMAPDGSVMGVLDVSGDPRCIQTQTASLVRMAGQMIEHRIALDIMPAETEILRFAHDPALIGSHREALLWIRGGLLIGANRAALRVLGMTFEQLCDRFVDDVFRTLPAMQRDPSALELQPHLLQPGRHMNWSASWVRRPGAMSAATPQCAPRVDDMPRRGLAPTESPIVGDAERDAKIGRAVRVLDADIPVLVTGESGVGKEVFAREIHALSRRAAGPFVAINCAAVPEGLIEAELFGYEDGAFTGARKRGSPGLIREASGGVLFLDEIGDMPLMLQARLLRVLQDHEVKSLGGGRAEAVDFALVCATHRQLGRMATSGTFRADLYYRLQHFTVELPALRNLPDHRSRIDAYLREALLRRDLRLSPQAREAMLNFDWPGNWRQLASVCQTLVALTEPMGCIELADLPEELRAAARIAAPPSPAAPAIAQIGQADLRSVTESAIDAAIAACGGNISRAARMLGVHRSTLYRHASAGRQRDVLEKVG